MPYQPYAADHYLSFEEVVAFCEGAAAAHPEWVRLETIGETLSGRPILLLTISKQDAGVEGRPAFWLDGATHASEWTGVAACVLAVSRWLDALQRGDATEVAWFSEYAAYVVPVISADGYAHTRSGRPFVRSTLRPPRDGRPRVGLSVQDVDGDGEALWMRWRHPTGPYLVDDSHPAGFRPRTLGDPAEDACYVCMEGLFLQWDGVRWQPAAREFGVDLNRNFPSSWAPRSMWGQDGGTFALSEPESRAIVDAVHARPRIAVGLSMHTFTGALLTQPYRKDSPLGEGDIQLMERMGKAAVAGTGYRVLRVVPDFAYDPDEPIGGVWADTLSTTFGVPGYTLELWDPFGFAGVTMDKPATFFRSPDPEVVDALFRAFIGQDRAWEPWRDAHHDQLGDVQIGGLRFAHTLSNPPARLLAEEAAKGVVVADRLRQAMPRVHCSVTVEDLGDVVCVEAVVENRGYLPTGATAHAQKIGTAPPVVLSLETDGEVVQGDSPVSAGWLDGWGSLQVDGGARWIQPGLGMRGCRARIRWLVRGGSRYKVDVDGGRAGVREVEGLFDK